MNFQDITRKKRNVVVLFRSGAAHSQITVKLNSQVYFLQRQIRQISSRSVDIWENGSRKNLLLESVLDEYCIWRNYIMQRIHYDVSSINMLVTEKLTGETFYRKQIVKFLNASWLIFCRITAITTRCLVVCNRNIRLIRR